MAAPEPASAAEPTTAADPLAGIVGTVKGKLEAKVIAGMAGSGGGAIVGQFVVYLLGTTIYAHGVPDEVKALVLTGCAAGVAAVAGWLAPHTARPDQPVV